MYKLSSLIENKIYKNCIGQKKDLGESMQKTVLWNKNYGRENKDYANALIYVHVVLNGVVFP